MFVPVTTKPYLNSANFIILQQGIPAFFLLIKEKVNKHITFREKVNGMCYVNNSDTSLYGIIQLTLQTYSDPMVPFRVFTSFVFSESHLKEEFYNGKSSGI
jgi:hypothetical protein